MPSTIVVTTGGSFFVGAGAGAAGGCGVSAGMSGASGLWILIGVGEFGRPAVVGRPGGVGASR